MKIKEAYIDRLEHEPAFIRKRRFVLFAFTVRMFFVGVEYSVILPSVWLYVKSYNLGTIFAGIAVALYPLAGALVLPITGRIFDKTHRTKELVFILNFFQIIGNLIYAIPISPWCLFVGRLLAGLGDGFTGIATGEIACVYQAKYRTAIYSLMELGRVLGLILGPCLNFLIVETKWNVYIGTLSFRIDKTTFPGILMAIGWLVHELITFLCITNLSKEVIIMYEDASSGASTHVDDLDQNLEDDDGIDEEDDDLIDSAIFSGEYGELKRSASLRRSSQKKKLLEKKKIDPIKEKVEEPSLGTSATLMESLREIMHVEFVILFFAENVLWISQTAFEILLPIVTEKDYSWKSRAVGLVYTVGGVELVIMFVLIYTASLKFSYRDSYMMLLSLVLTLISMGLMVLEHFVVGVWRKEYVFTSICVLIFGAIPLNLVASKAILAKTTRVECQGVVQGVFAGVGRISLIAGPVLGGLAYNSRVWYASTMGVLSIISFIAIVCCLRKFDRRELALKEYTAKMEQMGKEEGEYS